MSLNLPSEEEVPLSKCRVLYLGTNYFTNTKPDNDGNIKVNLKLIQDTIAKRYPVNGEKYAEGIETWLSIFPSGIQIEHSKIEEIDSNALFYFPIKSLVYCGALRLIGKEKGLTSDRKWKFVPLDVEAANESKNLKNPPLFVTIVRGVDPSSKGENIECHVFVIRMKKTAMRLVECCQKAYNRCTQSVTAFRNKYDNIPAVFTSEGLKGSAIVKKYDDNGFFYVINDASIDLWQLYESNIGNDEKIEDKLIVPKKNPPVIQPSSSSESTSSEEDSTDLKVVRSDNYVREDLIDPYEDAPNLVKVERTIDPATGQNIYVRWLANDEPIETTIIETQRIHTPSPAPPPLVIRETQPTPEPVIVEKIIQKKKPQLIIKEIHVSQPSPPPIKVVEKILSESNSNITPAKTIYKKTAVRSPSRHKSRHHEYSHYIDSNKLNEYAHLNNNVYKNPDYHIHNRKKSKTKNYDFIYNNADVENVYKKLYQPINDNYYSADNHYLYESPSKILFHNKPMRPCFHNLPPPVYAYHHHRRHHHHYHRPVNQQIEHISRRTPKIHYNDQVSYVSSQKSKHSSNKSEPIKLKPNLIPPKPVRQVQEPKRQYRKIFVMDDTDESSQKLKPTTKIQKNLPQHMNTNGVFINGHHNSHIKFRPKNGYF